VHQAEQAAAIGLVNRKQIRAFAELDFVARHENLVYVGKTGVAKTGLAVASC
jgi:DNA replication protein DnaC